MNSNKIIVNIIIVSVFKYKQILFGNLSFWKNLICSIEI